MLADVAQCQRAEHRIAQGMQGHVAIAVRFDAAIMRDAHAAQHDVVARAESMHVETLADPHRHVAALRTSESDASTCSDKPN